MCVHVCTFVCVCVCVCVCKKWRECKRGVVVCEGIYLRAVSEQKSEKKGGGGNRGYSLSHTHSPDTGITQQGSTARVAIFPICTAVMNTTIQRQVWAEK